MPSAQRSFDDTALSVKAISYLRDQPSDPIRTTINGQVFGSSRGLPSSSPVSSSPNNAKGGAQTPSISPKLEEEAGSYDDDDERSRPERSSKTQHSAAAESNFPASVQAAQEEEGAGHPFALESRMDAGSSSGSRPGRLVLPKIAAVGDAKIRPLQVVENEGNEERSCNRAVQPPLGAVWEPKHDHPATHPQEAVPVQGKEGPVQPSPVQKTELVRPSKIWRFTSLPSTRVNPTALNDEEDEGDAADPFNPDSPAEKRRMQVKKSSLEKFKAASPQGVMMMRNITRAKEHNRKALQAIPELESAMSRDPKRKSKRTARSAEGKRSWLHQYLYRVSDSAYLVVFLPY